MIRDAHSIMRLFPSGVVATETETTKSLLSALHPNEADIVRHAAPKRAHEFAAGRLCARKALAKLSGHEPPLLANADRTPQWPTGVVGTISHTHGYCAAAVAHDSAFVGIGLDVETAEAVDEKILMQICTDEDLYWLNRQHLEVNRRWATVLFTAKEAFYKCQYSVTHAWLDFRDVSICLGGAEFLVRSENPVVRALLDGGGLVGRFVEERGRVISAMALRAAWPGRAQQVRQGSITRGLNTSE
jgi:4'-phosphopantetheinyl transferase EntD